MQASPAQFWRHRYPRPRTACAIGTAGVLYLRGGGAKAAQRARQKLLERRAEQDRQQRCAGYVGHAELAHQIEAAIRSRYAGERFAQGLAEYAAQLCAPGGQWNFQGNWRLAELLARCLRTAQRYRARLEADGLIVSYCLEPGDMLPGMKAPVTHAQIVRDVSGLRKLVPSHPLPPLAEDLELDEDEPSSARPSAADVPGALLEEMSADDLQDLIDLTPAYMDEHRIRLIERRDRALERANRRLPVVPPPGCVIVEDEEIDRWERDTDSLERWIEHQRQHRRERAPPG